MNRTTHVTACLTVLAILAFGVGYLPLHRAVVYGQTGSAAIVSAANYAVVVTPDSIAAAFGIGLATATQVANTKPLPIVLAGTTVKVDGRDAGIFFVSPGQINFLIPTETKIGKVPVVIRAGNGAISEGTVEVRAVAPSIFTANATGRGVPAALLLRLRGTAAIYEPVARFDAQQQTQLPLAIDMGPNTDQVFLVLFGTGVRKRNALTDVSVRIGGLTSKVLYAGAQGDLVGVDQLNVEIPRELTSSGPVNVLVSITGAPTASETGIEIAPPCASTAVQIASLNATTLLAGQELIINGANFATAAADNAVRVMGDETQPEAQVIEATASRLRVYVPFSASSGRISVSTRQGTACSQPVVLRNSISGFIQDNARQPIRDVTVRYVEANISAKTNAEGAFVLPDVPASASATIQVDGTTAASNLPYPNQQFKMRVRANRDNQVEGYIELKQASGSALVVGTSGIASDQSVSTLAEWPAKASAPDGQIQTGQVIFDVPNNATVRFPNGATSGVLTLTVLESGRTPGTLPSGQFSPVIAQITPFGVTIAPGAKLTFPNPDGYAPNAPLKLYRYDQRVTVNGQPNPRLGTFVEAGTATVSADGQRIESAVNAVTETSYYFASGARTTVTLIGRVVENNLNRTPVRRSLVNSRGQGIFTDGNGGFVIRNVPVNASAAAVAQLGGEITLEPGATEALIADDRVNVEADFMRPSTRVDRSQQEQVPPIVNTVTITPDLVLNSNRSPTITAPSSTTANAGTAKDVSFLVSDPDAGQTVQVTVEGASFASVIKGSGDSLTLRLSPGANDGGNYTLVITASDGRGGTATKEVKLRVNGSGPIANEQLVSVNRNTAKAITLSGSDPQRRALTFIITSFPTRGSLTGAPPNVTYTPPQNYVGADSFSFKVRAGQAESDEAQITLNVQQVNTPPSLTVPGNQSTNGGETLKFTVTASELDAGQTLTFLRPTLPLGATVEQTSPTSLLFSWTPTINQAASYEVTFTVTDNGTPALSVSKKVQITVEAKWAKTSGPDGGIGRCFVSLGGALYAGMLGGIYRSSDDGQNWTAVNNGLTTASSVLALHAVGSNLFAGTFRRGIYRSDDNGQNWTPVNNGLTGNALSVRALHAVGSNLFVGTFGSGIYRSSDNGQNWTPVNNGLSGNALSVRALHAVGSNLFAGTEGSGIYRSGDNGQNWTPVNNGLTGNTLIVRTLHAIGNNLFAGADGSVYRSGDNGQNWTPINNGPSCVNALYAVGSNLFAGTDCGNGIYRSSDNGQNWTPVNNGLIADGLFVNALYAVGSNLFAGMYDGLYRSSDNGQNWTPVNNGLTASVINALYAVGSNLFAGTFGRGLYRSGNNGQNWTPVNNGLGNDLYVYALYAVGSNLFAGTLNSGVYRSGDNGQNWMPVNNGLGSALNVNALYAVGSNLFVGTFDGGLYRSGDNGQNWTSVNNELTGNALLVRALHAVGSNLFVGTFGSGIYRSSDNGQNWTPVNNGLTGNALSVSALHRVGSNLFAGTEGSGIYRSGDNGQNWMPVNNGLTGNALIVRTLHAIGNNLFAGTDGSGIYRSGDNGQSWVGDGFSSALQPFVLSFASDGTQLFAGTNGSSVFILSDNVQSWRESNTNLSTKFINAVAVNNATLFAGTLGGGIFRSTDQGQTWTLASTNLSPSANIQSVITNGTTIWAASFGDGVYRSTNQGTSWTAVNTGLNNKAVNKLFLNGATLYAGTEGGVYRSTNNGDNWTLISTGMGTLPVDSFTVLNGVVYAGTDGSGVFKLNSDGVSWTPKSKGLTSQQVRSLGVNGNVLYAGMTGGGICLSRDGGENWIAVNNQLPPTLNVFAFATSGKKVYAGSIYGVFFTEDEGQNWKQINAGLLNTYVTGLAVSGDQLYASTASGGIFVSRIPQ